MLHKVINFVRFLVNEWNKDGMWINTAAISFYLMFAIAPLIFIVIFVISFLTGTSQTGTGFSDQLSEQFSPELALIITELVNSLRNTNISGYSSVLAFGGVFFALYGLVSNLQIILNRLWEVTLKPENLKDWIYLQIKSFSLIIILITVALLAIIFSNLVRFLGVQISLDSNFAWVDLLSLFIFTWIFIIFLMQLIIETDICWQNLILGSFISSVLLMFGKEITDSYFNNFSLTESYGAAASVVLLLLWINYSVIIFFVGVEIIKVLDFRRLNKIKF
jgi:membrane protein